MKLVSIILLLAFAYYIGYLRGKDPHFFKTYKKTVKENWKRKPKKSANTKIVSIEQLKRNKKG